jgi:hypothetical protein
MAVPINKSLYNKVKAEAKRRFKVWPSAYGSGWLVREYKRRGGKYREGSSSRSKSKIKKSKRSYRQKSKGKGLTRWFDEKWINICKLPKKVSCGRSKSLKKNYPYCRPSRRVNSQTPVLASELSKSEIKRRCSRKRKSPYKRLTSKRR